MNKKNLKKKEKIKKLLKKDNLVDQEREFIESLKNFIEDYDHLTYNQTRGLYNLYHKYFINISESKKENKSLDNFKK